MGLGGDWYVLAGTHVLSHLTVHRFTANEVFGERRMRGVGPDRPNRRNLPRILSVYAGNAEK